MAMNQLYPIQQAEIRHLLAMYQQLPISQLLRFSRIYRSGGYCL